MTKRRPICPVRKALDSLFTPVSKALKKNRGYIDVTYYAIKIFNLINDLSD